MTCTHTSAEADTAWACDGLCALCLHADNTAMRAALEAALALLPATEFHGDHYGGYSTPSRAEVLAARALVAAALGRTP